jgi:hypothetical protein
MALTRAQALKIMLSVEGASEGPYFGRPSVFHGEAFVGRVHDKEEAVVLRVGSIEMRDVMLEAEPKLFYITEHYRTWPGLLARLPALDTKTLKSLVIARIGEIEANPARKRTKKQVKQTAAKKVSKKKKKTR